MLVITSEVKILNLAGYVVKNELNKIKLCVTENELKESTGFGFNVCKPLNPAVKYLV